MVSEKQEQMNQMESGPSVTSARDLLLSLRDDLESVLIGQEKVVDLALVCLVAKGHILLEGTPGLGKTLFIKALGHVCGFEVNRVQFTPDLMPSDILGGERLEETDGRVSSCFRPGPIFSNVLLADEINRANPRTQAALLEAMGERQVTVAGNTTALPDPFFVFASQNPLDMQGTYPLPEAQLDRFMMRIELSRPNVASLVQIIEVDSSERLHSLARRVSPPMIVKLQNLSRTIPCSSDIVRMIGKLIDGSWDACQVEVFGRRLGSGVSPRAGQDLYRACQARALMSGRLNVTRDDLRYLAEPILNHRIVVPARLLSEGTTPRGIVKELVERFVS